MLYVPRGDAEPSADLVRGGSYGDRGQPFFLSEVVRLMAEEG